MSVRLSSFLLFLVIDDNPLSAYKRYEINIEIFEPWL